MSNRILIDKAIAGLGNRLRCVASAIEYAQATNRKVYIDWCDGMFAAEGTNAFNMYFNLTGVGNVETLEGLDIETYYPSAYKFLPHNECIYNHFEKKQINNRFLRKIIHYLFLAAKKIQVVTNSSLLEDKLSGLSRFYQCFRLKEEYQNLYHSKGEFEFGEHLSKNHNEDAVVYCDNIPFYKKETMVKHIRLCDEMQRKVNHFVEEHEINRNTVGVHVRSSGKKCYGDMQRFIKKLRLFNLKHDIGRVFLCTDNGEIEQLFKHEFGDSLIVQDKYLPSIRKGETGIHDFAQNSNDEDLKRRLTQEAIIDMFALSQTTYLFYQFGSTFSEISKVYHSNASNCKAWLFL